MHIIYYINPFYSGYSKQDLWQTLKTLMKYRIRWYFLRVCTACYDKKNLRGGGGGGWCQSDYGDYTSFLVQIAELFNFKFVIIFFIQKFILYFGCSKEPSR